MSQGARLFLLLAALLARLAIPTGFMLAPTGAASLVACPEAVAAPMRMPSANHATAGQQHDPTAHAKRSCPYAAMAAPAIPPAPPIVLAVAIAPKPIALAPLPAIALARPLAAPPPPSRGPPFLS